MPTRRFRRIALASQLLVVGCSVVFGACVLIKHAQAQQQFVPPAPPVVPPPPPPVLDPSQYHRTSTELQTHLTHNTKYRGI